MIEHEKYARLAERMRGEGKMPSHQDQAEFYFRQLERLEIDLLVAEIEVSEQHRQIAALQNKIGTVQAEHQQSQNRKLNESSSEELPKEHACPLKDCGKRFQKQSDLGLHHRLAHSNDCSWMQDSLFQMELE